jgi:nicotinamide phosphoribosyltransferase
MTLPLTSLQQLENLPDDLLFNVILDSDSYKTSHWMQYPPGTEYVYSYLESRGGQFDKTVMFGLQYIIKKYLTGPVVTHEMIDVAKLMIVEHMGGDPRNFNEEGWRYIVDHHGGHLPLLIKAIPEGTRIGTHNALVTVVNTDPKCYWLVNYVETMLMRLWYPITVASLSAEIKDIIREYLELSGDPETLEGKLVFMLQDFGSRGSTSRESAAIGAAAHMVNFRGTDTMVGLSLALKYYRPDSMPGFSVPAAEHSTITSWGRDREAQAYANMLQSYPTGIVSIVSDSYDIFNACSEIFGRELKAEVASRNGTVVVRPDSGEIIPTILKLLEILGDRFGYETNRKGYKVLPQFVRLLQGDGMNIHTIRALCRAITDAGWSIDNMACFGMGGKLLQGVDRDTLKFAFKCSAIRINGVWYDVYKDPVGDKGKGSKRGVHKVVFQNGNDKKFHTVSSLIDPFINHFGDHLVTVFLDGVLTNEYSLTYIRERVGTTDYGKRVVGASWSRDV